MSNYKLTLLIDNAIFAAHPTDNFCIAKKVNGSFTTVFQDASIQPKRADQQQLHAQNDFEWTDHYRVSAAVKYEHGILVSSATNAVEIRLGEETKYNGNGFGAASPADHSIFENSSGASSFEDSFMALQVPNNLHTSVQLEVKGSWVPIYVDPDNHIGVMDKQLTPLNEYMLFWNNKVQTSSMIDSSRFHEPFTFTFKGSDKSKTVRFGYAVPEKPSGSENAKFYDN